MMKRTILSKYVGAMSDQPSALADYLVGLVLIVSHALPLRQRIEISERLRDLADTIERPDFAQPHRERVK